MKKTVGQIKNYIQLHTSDTETSEYISIMREIAEWATFEADRLEYGEELESIFNEG